MSTMNVASLELCKELYELSGWDDTARRHPSVHDKREDWPPAYTLGYLLRKLSQAEIGVSIRYVDSPHGVDLREWLHKFIAYAPWMAQGDYPFADIPEDAAAKLAIELFKQGVLKKEGEDEFR